MSLVYWPSPAEFSQQTLRPVRRRRPLSAAGPRKPLRLDGRIRRLEVHSAGAALAIERDGRRITLPLTRIARIVVIGRVRWDSEALLQCLALKIPVVFSDSHGQPAGAALPLTARQGNLNELLERFVELPAWRVRYENWLRAQRAIVFLRWRASRPADATAPDGATVAEFHRSFVHRGEAEWAAPMRADAYALVLEVLTRAALPTQVRAIEGAPLALAADLAALLAASKMLGVGSLAAALTADPAVAARAHAAALADGEAHVVHLLRKLRKNVAEWVEPWP